ncbi:MAG: hypothetical protein HN701_15775, partial [Rhodospirillaceae bacterium]|nr:hypothetical protein [Rhodospirillaceae bacterium]
GWVLGPVGMLLSIPLTIMLKIALESQDETRWIGVMMGAGKRLGSESSTENVVNIDSN